jgi:hypothetical protein
MINVVLIAALLWSGDLYSSQGDSTSRKASSFQSAVSIAVDPDGILFVADRGTHKVIRCSGNGKPALDAGGFGWSSSGFDEPLDVCAPTGIDVYVADYGNHRIQRLDRNLTIVSGLSLRDNEDPDERFGYPRSVAVDRFGSLFIVDGENERVVKIRNANAFERAFGGLEAGKGRLRAPTRIRVSDDDVVYVQDGNAIVAFDLFGNYIRRVGEGLFTSLRILAVDGATVYVIDSCSVIRITGKGAHLSRGSITGIPPAECGLLVDMAIKGNDLWLLTGSAILRRNVNEVFSFPEDQQR